MSQLFLISNWKTSQNGHVCWVSYLIMKGTLLAELFTIMMPVLAVLFGLLIFWILSVFGGAI